MQTIPKRLVVSVTGFLAASFGLEPGVRPSCLSPGAARRSEWLGLAVDVLLDDGRGCGCAGDGEIGRRPQVAAYAGADTRAGEFAPYRVGGAALEAMGESGYRRRGRIGDQEMQVVGFAGGLDQLDSRLGAHGARRGFGEGGHRIGERFAPELGHEYHMGVQQRHAVPVAAVGRGCRWSVLWCGGADG